LQICSLFIYRVDALIDLCISGTQKQDARKPIYFLPIILFIYWMDSLCCWNHEDDNSSGDEVEDRSAGALSYVGTAAYDTLRKHHNHHHHTLWNVTTGVVIGAMQDTPTGGFPRDDDPADHHDDWFCDKICEIIAKTEVWCDIMSLGPPDGLFLEKIKESFSILGEKGKKIIIRMMFGNIIGMPVNCMYLL